MPRLPKLGTRPSKPSERSGRAFLPPLTCALYQSLPMKNVDYLLNKTNLILNITRFDPIGGICPIDHSGTATDLIQPSSSS